MTTTNSADLHIRLATSADASAVWQILKGEIEVMRACGRRQWQYGYPNPEVVDADIKARQGRVLVSNTEVVGYCALITSGDPCYDHIWDGEWLTPDTSSHCRYTVVHRLAISPGLTGRGLAAAFLQMLIAESAGMGRRSMRIDTNFDNAQMLHLLAKLGFTRCGMIMVKDGERHAFEKLF